MSAPAERHVLEEVLGTVEPRFDDVFPSCFGWRALCQDAPQMVARLEGRDPDAIDRDEEVRTRRLARRTFRYAWLAAMVALALADEDDADPRATLDARLAPLSSDVERRFLALVGSQLEPLEAHLGGEARTLSPLAEAALAHAETAWPLVVEAIEEAVAGASEDEGDEAMPLDEDAAPAVATVVRGLARLGVLLAALRVLAEGGAAQP